MATNGVLNRFAPCCPCKKKPGGRKQPGPHGGRCAPTGPNLAVEVSQFCGGGLGLVGVGGLALTITGASGGIVYSGVTADDGTYVDVLAPGDYVVTVTAPGGQTASAPLHVGADCKPSAALLSLNLPPLGLRVYIHGCNNVPIPASVTVSQGGTVLGSGQVTGPGFIFYGPDAEPDPGQLLTITVSSPEYATSVGTSRVDVCSYAVELAVIKPYACCLGEPDTLHPFASCARPMPPTLNATVLGHAVTLSTTFQWPAGSYLAPGDSYPTGLSTYPLYTGMFSMTVLGIPRSTARGEPTTCVTPAIFPGDPVPQPQVINGITFQPYFVQWLQPVEVAFLVNFDCYGRLSVGAPGCGRTRGEFLAGGRFGNHVYVLPFESTPAQTINSVGGGPASIAFITAGYGPIDVGQAPSIITSLSADPIAVSGYFRAPADVYPPLDSLNVPTVYTYKPDPGSWTVTEP